MNKPGLHEAVFSAARRQIVAARLSAFRASASHLAPWNRGGEVALIRGCRPFSCLWVSPGSGPCSRLWERTVRRHRAELPALSVGWERRERSQSHETDFTQSSGKKTQRIAEGKQHRGFFENMQECMDDCYPVRFNWICCNSVKVRNLWSRDKGRFSSRHHGHAFFFFFPQCMSHLRPLSSQRLVVDGSCSLFSPQTM